MQAMTGDYSRFTFDLRKRFSGVLQQQGRVQLDADWNEAVSIFRRRMRLQALDTFGPVGVAQLTTPDAFDVSVVAGPPLDLALKPGRIYVDGILAELFPNEAASYRKQPFFPDPPPLPSGDAVVYLDLWEREVTYIEDPSLLEPALGGVDTATRTQNIWQLKVDARPGATCGMTVGVPASAGRLSTEAIAPPAPGDPCLLPPVAGYRGLENRLYRIETTGGALGTARFKWSRDNGSIVSAVTDIAVSGGETTLTVSRLGRDQVLRFVVGNWVTVTDDFRELAGEPGETARILAIDEANAKLVLDRALPSAGGRAFGATAADLAARHTRVQRWDQNAATNTIDADGLILTGPGPIDIEEGIRVRFSTDPAGGVFNAGDYWVFWARTATASIEILNGAPPRGIVHHYVQLAAIIGLGGPSPVTTDCRPPPKAAEQCCCTIVVAPEQDIQKAIASLPAPGGCICLKAGLHLIPATLIIARNNVRLVGESPGTIVRVRGAAAVLLIGMRAAVQDIVVSGIAFERQQAGNGGAVIEIGNARRILIEDCTVRASAPPMIVGMALQNVQAVAVTRCRIEQVESGIWILGKGNAELSATDNLFSLAGGAATRPWFGIFAQFVETALRIENNLIDGAANGILINENLTGPPRSATTGVEIVGNMIRCAAAVPPAAGVLLPPTFGIDSAAADSAVSRNLVLLSEDPSAARIGIRLTGGTLAARDNDIAVLGAAGERNPPIGIALGYSVGADTVLTTDVAVPGNTILGCPLGIVATAVNGAAIAGNFLELSARPAGLQSAGITLVGTIGVAVHDNRAVGFTFAISSTTGTANRYAGNILGTGNYGVWLVQETTPMVTQNRITDMRLAAVAGSKLIARCDVTDNRIAACGYVADRESVPSSIAIYGIQGGLHIGGNEIIDTGVPLAGSPIAPVYGIHAIGVQEAIMEGNEVTYTNPEKRDAAAEDRALRIQGLIEADTSVQILGNKFVGAGRSALVELLETRINDVTFLGFERVIFSNNFCRHFVGPAFAPPLGTATVRLTGRAASVIGNQVKSVQGFPSFDFNNMRGPFMGNVISGPVTGRAPADDLPSPVGAYNLTI
jgi:hypothetical protein